MLIVQPGRDQKLGTDTTDFEGEWVVEVAGLKDGTRLKAKLKPGFTLEFNCGGDTSQVRTWRKP